MRHLAERLHHYRNSHLSTNRMVRTRDAALLAHRVGPDPLRPASRLVSDRVSTETLTQIVEDYQAGVPTTTLCRQHHIGKGTVLRLLAEHGVSMRRQPMTAAQQRTVIALYAKGWSLAKIGTKFGRHPTAIRDVLERAGVSRRSPQFRASSEDRSSGVGDVERTSG
jgi:hypothetical protein